MSQTVTVPGVGDLEFPDGMSQPDMAAAIQKNFPHIGAPQAPAPAPAAPAPAPSLSDQISNGISQAAGAVSDAADFVTSGVKYYGGQVANIAKAVLPALPGQPRPTTPPPPPAAPVDRLDAAGPPTPLPVTFPTDQPLQPFDSEKSPARLAAEKQAATADVASVPTGGQADQRRQAWDSIPQGALRAGFNAAAGHAGNTVASATAALGDVTGSDKLAQLGSDFHAAANARIDRAMLGNEDSNTVKTVAGVFSLAPLLGGNATGLASMVTQAGIDGYGDARRAGDSPGEAVSRGTAMALANYVGMRVQLPGITGALSTAVMKAPAADALAALGHAVTTNVGGMEATTVLSDLYDKVAPGGLRPDMTAADMIRDIGETAKSAALLSLAVPGVPLGAGHLYGAAHALAHGDGKAAARDLSAPASGDTAAVPGAPAAAAPIGLDTLHDSIDETAGKVGLSPQATAALRDAAAKQDPQDAPGFIARAFHRFEANGLTKRAGAPGAFRDSLSQRLADQQPDEPTAPPAAKGPSVADQLTAIRPLEQSDAAAPAAEEAPDPAAPAPITPEAMDKANEVADAAHQAATSPFNDQAQPTDAQKEAGNYAMGHVQLHGLDVTIENPQGSVRSGVSPDGTAWHNEMAAHYGYIKGTHAGDGDHVDVFIGPNPESKTAFVIDQVDPNTGKFDEPKTILGADSEAQARELYAKNYADGWNGLGAITPLPMDAFKAWVRDGVKSKPLGDISEWKPDERAQSDVAGPADVAPGAGDVGGGPAVAGGGDPRPDPAVSAGRDVGGDAAAPAGGARASGPVGDGGSSDAALKPAGPAPRLLGKPVTDYETPALLKIAGMKTTSLRARDVAGAELTRRAVEARAAAPAPAGRAAPSGAAKHPATVQGSRLLSLVSKNLGGLDPAWLGEFSSKQETKRLGADGRPITQWKNPLIPGVGKLFRRGGTQDLESIANMLEEHHYLPPGTVERDAHAAGQQAQEIIRAALNRVEAKTMDEQQAEDEASRHAEADTHYAALDAASARDAESERQAMFEAHNIDPSAFDRLMTDEDVAHGVPDISDHQALADFLGLTPEELDNERSTQEAAGLTGEDRAGVEGGRDATEGSQPSDEAGSAAPRLAGEGDSPGLTAREPDAPYTDDLFGHPLLDTDGTTRRAGSDRDQLPRDVQPAAAVPGKSAEPAEPGKLGDTPAPAGEYRTRTIVGSEVERKLGTDRITSAHDAAVATQYLYKSAVERFDGIVTDAGGKPLATIGGFKGALAQASVYPGTLMGEAVRIPGAAKVWFSHNHPSGSPELSLADKRLYSALENTFRGSGIEPQGILAIGGGKFSAYSGSGVTHDGEAIRASTTTAKVPAIEREVAQREAGVVIDSPMKAKDVADAFYQGDGDKPGLILMNSQLAVTGWVPLTSEMLGKLRGTGGLRSIMRGISEANAGSAILVHGGELDAHVGPGQSVAENIGGALKLADVRLLDVINAKTGESYAQRGRDLASSVVLKQSAEKPPLKGVDPVALRSEVGRIQAGWKDAPPVHVVDSVDGLPKHIQDSLRSMGAEGKTRALLMPGRGSDPGDVYLIANRLRDVPMAQAALFHEVLGHYGIRKVLGSDAKYFAEMFKLRQANPELAREAEAWWQMHGRGALADRISRGASPDAAMKIVRALSTEEALADRAGQGKPIRGLQSLMSKIQEWLRGVGMHSVADRLESMTQAETAALLAKARSTVEATEPSSYHGDELAPALSESGHEPPALSQAGTGDEEPVAKTSSGHAAAALAKVREAGATFTDAAKGLRDDALLKVAPMALGTAETRTVAKNFANADRLARWQWDKFDDVLKKNYDESQRKAMWEAADEESVLRQQGIKPSDAQGLNRLTPDQRKTMDTLHDYGESLLQRARDVGMFQGEGLPYWTPRMAVMVGGDGEYLRPKGTGAETGAKQGGNIVTSASSLKARKHLTAEDTEAAMKGKLGDGAQLVRDIRTMPLAMARLERAIAGRELVNNIKAMGDRAGLETVSTSEQPGFFTVDHPAFKTWQVRKDENGVQTMEARPLYVNKAFEGPLKAVMSEKLSPIYQALMGLKAKSMGLIMYSPLIHNAVEWGRALPAMPGKVATFQIYFEGNRIKNDPVQMRAAINDGLVPIGKRGGIQDITGIIEDPTLKPGRSWTAKLIGGALGLANEKAGTMAKKGIDAAGDFWHNTLLWDRVGDLQAGLYGALKQKEIDRGVSPEVAGKTAAHFANRFAGALPNESMGAGARKVANLLMFSRTFTLGNLGLMKDMITGLPRDIRSQIRTESGALAEATAVSRARRIAIASFIVDVGLMYVGNSLMQDAVKKMRGEKSWGEIGQGYLDRLHKLMQRTGDHPLDTLSNPFDVANSMSSTSENEPGKEDRIRVGTQDDGTAIYMRLPTGKVGEDFKNWITKPLITAKAKESQLLRPLQQVWNNDNGIGQRIYDPDAVGLGGVLKNAGRIAKTFATQMVPTDAIQGALDWKNGKASDVDKLKVAGPLAGLTFSKGAPGGPEVGAMYDADRRFLGAKMDTMPAVKQAIKDGDDEKAIALMEAIRMTPSEINSTLRRLKVPESRMSTGAFRNFNKHASDEDQQKMMDLLRGEQAAKASRAAASAAQ